MTPTDTFDMRHSTAFYRGISFARLELNRDIKFKRVVTLSYLPVDPLAPYVRANQMILVDTRTGLRRIARLVDINLDKGHLLTPAYDAYRRERNIKGSYLDIYIDEFKRLQGVDEEGGITEEMIKSYLEHHFEPRPNDEFRMEGE